MNKKFKIKISTIYIILVDIWVIVNTLKLSNLSVSLGVNLGDFYNKVNIFIYVALFFKLIFDFSKCNNRERIKLLILLAITIGSYLTVDSDFLYPAMIFILTSRRIDIHRTLKNIMIILKLTILFIVVGFFTGIIQQSEVTRTSGALSGNVRYSLGFSHPNVLGSMLLMSSLLSVFVYWKNDRKRKEAYLTCVISFLVSYFIADSRTAAYLTLLTLISLVIISVANNGNSIWNRMSSWIIEKSRMIVPAIFIISVLVATGAISIGVQDYTFQTRLAFMSNYMNYYKIKIFGQNLITGYNQISRYSDNSLNYYLYTLDNSYIYLLLGFGVVVSLWFVLSYILRLKKATVEKDYALIIVLLIMAIDGFVETSLIRFNFNYFILLFADLIWDYNNISIISRSNAKILSKI